MHLDLPSMRIVGYRQAWEYFEGKIDYETMKQKAIAATRQLAKRQMTWLRSWKNLMVLDPSNSEAHALAWALCSEHKQ
jgi:tRNA dimethylallyltransferase